MPLQDFKKAKNLKPMPLEYCNTQVYYFAFYAHNNGALVIVT